MPRHARADDWEVNKAPRRGDVTSPETSDPPDGDVPEMEGERKVSGSPARGGAGPLTQPSALGPLTRAQYHSRNVISPGFCLACMNLLNKVAFYRRGTKINANLGAENSSKCIARRVTRASAIHGQHRTHWWSSTSTNLGSVQVHWNSKIKITHHRDTSCLNSEVVFVWPVYKWSLFWESLILQSIILSQTSTWTLVRQYNRWFVNENFGSSM